MHPPTTTATTPITKPASRRAPGALLVALLMCATCARDSTAILVRDADAAPVQTPAAGAVPSPAVAPDPDAAAVIDAALAKAEHPGLSASAIPDVADDLRPLYQAEPDRLLWFDGATPTAALDRTVTAITAAGDHGLHAADYDAGRLAEQWAAIRGGQASAPERALFDLGVSVAAARMLRAVHNGRVDPATMQWGYEIERKPVDAPALLREAREGRGLAALLDTLQPPFAHYARARTALATYKAVADRGEPPTIPELGSAPAVKPGSAWAGLASLASRLRAFGDLTTIDESRSTTYTGALVEAVKRFQERHGLDADGVIGAGTVRALNVPVSQRVRQLELAMERMRWLPRLDDRPNIFVNVPLFRLWATDPATGDEPLRMDVVVGQALNHKTPLFIEQMEYVIFRPYWNPPRGITVREIIPHQRRDPTYFDREQLEIVASGADNAPALPPTSENLAAVVAGRLHIRQRPGPKNSLGLAKFIFPNAENVYMHGTPAQQLFSRVRRDFSHGCIRLEDPARFGEWILRDYPEWTRTRIDAAMHGDRPTRVNLRQPLTVVLFYDTVHVNSEGVLHFVDDIYGHDRTLDAALQRGYPYPVRAGTR